MAERWPDPIIVALVCIITIIILGLVFWAISQS